MQSASDLGLESGKHRYCDHDLMGLDYHWWLFSPKAFVKIGQGDLRERDFCCVARRLAAGTVFVATSSTYHASQKDPFLPYSVAEHALFVVRNGAFYAQSYFDDMLVGAEVGGLPSEVKYCGELRDIILH